MRPSRTAAVISAALLVVTFVPSTALARPVSVYTVDWTVSTGSGSVSLDLIVGEDGHGDAHFRWTSFEATTCGGSPDLATFMVTAHDSVMGSSFSVDRKLTSFHWTGDIEVSVVQTECGTTVTSNEIWTFDVSGSSTDRIRRSRSEGTRLLTTTLDPLTLTIDGVSHNGPGLLSKAVSRG